MGATCICKWSTPHSQNSISTLTQSITKHHQGVHQGRWTVQIRSLRQNATPSSSNPRNTNPHTRNVGRSMFIVRTTAAAEEAHVLIEDLSAIPKSQWKKRNDSIDSKPATDKVAPDSAASQTDPSSSHQQTTIPQPPHFHQTLVKLHASSFDLLANKVLLTSASSSSASASGGVYALGPGALGWIPRPSSVVIEGWVFAVGDFVVKVGSISVRGGAGSASTGPGGPPVIIELEYLPCPSLPITSPIFSSFLSVILPPGATRDVFSPPNDQWIDVDLPIPDEVGMGDSGKVKSKKGDGDDDEGWVGVGIEEEWTSSHSAVCYVSLLRKEGLV